jgi:hypothetical protein
MGAFRSSSTFVPRVFAARLTADLLTCSPISASVIWPTSRVEAPWT